MDYEGRRWSNSKDKDASEEDLPLSSPSSSSHFSSPALDQPATQRRGRRPLHFATPPARRTTTVTTTVTATNAPLEPVSVGGPRRRQVPQPVYSPLRADGSGAENAHSSCSTLEVTYSPKSTRLFRSHSFTALVHASPPPPEADAIEGSPRSRSVCRSGAEPVANGSFSSIPPYRVRQEQEATAAATAHSVGSPVSDTQAQSPVTQLIHSPSSGLYMPMRPAKDYFMSPVLPPFMPGGKNRSFFENILSSSDDDSDSVCSQCLHRPVKKKPVPMEGGIAKATSASPPPPAHRHPRRSSDDENEMKEISGHVTQADKPSPRRGRRRELPCGVNSSSSSKLEKHGRCCSWEVSTDCCYHHPSTCGKRCALHPSRGTSHTKEDREEVAREAQDYMIAHAKVFSWNLLAFGEDRLQPLFTFDEVPEWQKYNAYIRAGYRSFYTTAMTFRSLFGWHNETVNVWSHLLGFFFFVVVTILLFTTTLSTLVTAPSMSWSRWVYAIFSLGSMLCMFNSAMYHLFTGHRRLKIFTLMGRLDFLGITILIVASFLPPLYTHFHCHPGLRAFYTFCICALGVAGIVGPWTRAFHDFVWLRTVVYFLMAVSGVVPAIHALFLLPLSHIHTSFFLSQINGIIMMFLFYGIGVVFYVLQFPESYFPGKFDTILSSHQMWHFFVLMAACVHYCNSVSMYQVWQLTDGIC